MIISPDNVLSVANGDYWIAPQLYLRVNDKKRERFYFVSLRSKTSRGIILIGSAKTISLEDAKEKTIVIRKMWSDGIGLDEIKERIKVQKANESLEEYVNRIWERHSEEKGYKNPATLKNQMYALNKHVFTYFKGRAMRAINENDIREFLENLNARIPRSASNVGYLLKEIFDYAIRDGVYKRLNPVVLNHEFKSDPEKRELISSNELGEYILSSIMKNYSPALFIAFIAMSGSRKSEIRTLKWKNVNMGENYILVNRNSIKNSIPITAQMKEILYYIDRERESEYVFVGRRNNLYNSSYLSREVKKICSGKITMEGMRSVFRNWAAEKGLDSFLIELCLSNDPSLMGYEDYAKNNLLEKRRRLMQEYSDSLLPMDRLKNALEARESIRFRKKII